MTGLNRMLSAWNLVKRYQRAFSHAWKLRHDWSVPMFTEQEAEFLPAALSLQERPISSTALVTARVLGLLVVLLIIWSIVGRIDIVVSAQGKVISSGHIKTIASVDTASVRALRVVEGQAVRAGDVLVELDTSAIDAERDKAIDSRIDAVLQVARARAMIDALNGAQPPKWPQLYQLQQADPGISATRSRAEELHLEAMYRDFRAKIDRIEGEVDRYSTALELAARAERDYADLLQTHDIAEHAWLEKERARVDVKAQLDDAKKQRSALLAEIRREAYDQLTEGTKIAEGSRQDALRSSSHSKLLKLVSPVDGVVQQLTVHTVGGVVPAAQPLMQVVPSENNVEIEAVLDNKDIGFVREGQPAQVKVETFQYTKYGTVQATVAHVSRDAIQDEKKGLQYTSRIVLERMSMNIDGHIVALTPGMAVNVDIKTGDRRIVEYFLSPLLQHQRESLHER